MPARRGRSDHAVELPDRDPGVEADAGADLRQHGGHQAGLAHAAVRGHARRGCSRRRGCRRACSTSSPAAAARSASRWSTHPEVPVISFTGSTDIGRRDQPPARRTFKHVSSGDGRQERDHGDGRRRRRPRRRRRAVGRIRHGRPALHGGRRLHRAHRRCTTSSCEKLARAREELRVGNGLDRADGHGTGHRRRGGQDASRSTCRSARTKARAGHRRRARRDDGDYAKGYFHEPTVFADVTPEHAHRAGGDLRPGDGGHARAIARKRRSRSATA